MKASTVDSPVRPVPSRFSVTVALHHGFCFGVRDAVAAVEELAKDGPLTILGQLAHNETVRERLRSLGAEEGSLQADNATNRRVVITAHGASDREKEKWKKLGHDVTDLSCPLVKRAHDSLSALVQDGYFPIVIGRKEHVEVVGLTGDFPHSLVIESENDIECLPWGEKLGVISQTTQPSTTVAAIVSAIREKRPDSEVRFIDTVCRPTKERQSALLDLCQKVEMIIVVGGKNSNNSRELVATAIRNGCRAERVTDETELQADWFNGIQRVGVTGGTSTFPEMVDAVANRLREWATTPQQTSLDPWLFTGVSSPK